MSIYQGDRAGDQTHFKINPKEGKNYEINEHKQAGEIENSKMVDINLNVPIITLKANTPIKRQRLTVWRQKAEERKSRRMREG